MTAYDWPTLLTSWSDERLELMRRPEWTRVDSAAEGSVLDSILEESASEEEIGSLEQRLGVVLPPSYRAFLRTSNGFPTRCLRLFSAAEVARFAELEPEWLRIWLETGADETSDSRYFVYGSRQNPVDMRRDYLRNAVAISTTFDSGIFLLNPKVVTTDGEWEAWYFSVKLPGARRYRSFWDLMMRERWDELRYLYEDMGLRRDPRTADRALCRGDLEAALATLSAKPTVHDLRDVEDAIAFARDERCVEKLAALAARESAGDAHESVASAAVRIQGRVGGDAAFEVCWSALRSSTDPLVRGAAASALGEIGDRRATSALLDALLGSGTSEEASALSEARERIQSFLSPEMMEALRTNMLDILRSGVLGDHANIEEGMKRWTDPNLLKKTHEEIARRDAAHLAPLRRAAGLALKRMADPSSLERCGEGLAHHDMNVRIACAQILGELRDERSIGLLAGALDDEEKAVRTCAVRALAGMESERVVAALLQALDDSNEQTRASAAHGLAKFRNRPDVRAALERLARTEKVAWVRRTAESALNPPYTIT